MTDPDKVFETNINIPLSDEEVKEKIRREIQIVVESHFASGGKFKELFEMFKGEIVRLSEAQPVSRTKVAERLGINRGTLLQWSRLHGNKEGVNLFASK